MTHETQHRVADRMQSHVPTVTSEVTVAQARRMLVHEKEPWVSINYLYVLDKEKKLIGVFSIKELLTAKSDLRVADFMHVDPIRAHSHMHEERVAALAIAHGLKSVPVVDHDDRFLGIVPSDAILHILHEQHIESALRHAGFMKPHVHFLDVAKARFGELFRARVGWLAVGLVGGMLAAWVAHQFSSILETEILLAFFIPLVLYLSAAVGGQAGMLFIRSLAVERVCLPRYFFRELQFALFLGLFFGTVGYGLVWGIWGSATVAEVLGLTLFFSILVSTAVALVIPTILLRFGRDPAIGSGPFATIVQDLLSLLLYFLIASALL